MTKKPVPPLDQYQWRLLKNSGNNLLFFLIKIKEDKDFLELKNLISQLEDVEKNLFFAEREFKITDAVLAKKHTYARGKIQGMKDILYLMYGAQTEMDRREEETRKKLEEKKKQKEE